MAAAAPPVLYIGPSYANKSNTRVVDKITDPSTAPPQYDNLPLLQKYFNRNSAPAADYSTMPADDKKEILRMLKDRKDSLVTTLNVLKQTSSISLKNASMANRVQHMNDLMEEIRSGSTLVPAADAKPAAKAAATAKATPSDAPLQVDTAFAAAYSLLQRSDPSANAASSIQHWNEIKQSYSTLTLKETIDTITGSVTDSPDTPANATPYLLNARLASTLLAAPTDATTATTYRRKFVPIFEQLIGVINEMDENIDVVTALSTVASKGKATATTTFLNTLFATDPATYSPPATLPEALSALPVPPTATYDEIVYYTSYLLLQQFIAENK